jgi:metal-responsive CopG/Arc/MetJ family transcriptional regulator
MTEDLMDQIDEVRKEQDGLPTRPEMIRRMVEDWLSQHTRADTTN